MRITVAIPVCLAFVTGFAVSPLVWQLLPSASAQASAAGPGLVPMIIDIAALKDADLGVAEGTGTAWL
jgi:hypothetical protein